MSKIILTLRPLAIVLLAGMALAACEGLKTPSFQGSPPLSAVPTKVRNFTGPYLDHIGTGATWSVILMAPNFMPGRCEGMYLTGDRAVICDQLARYNGEEPPKPDPNARYSCIRTLGGATECSLRREVQTEIIPVPSP